MNDRKQPGIYVEILIRAPLERIWMLTQQPEFHQRWDLRFSRIEYLAKPDEFAPQQFLYETRIGAGWAIRGTGESIATRFAEDGSATSSLKFASADKLSLIREGAGYWRYIRTENGVVFLTWYDYKVRFGVVGRLLDKVFRPAMGWATAWSFDRLRIWAEHDVVPEISLQLAAIHTLCRMVIASVWFWHGLVPKLLQRDADEQFMLMHAGLAVTWLPWVGGAELVMAFLVLATWRWRGMFVVQALLMLVALVAIGFQSPAYLTRAFNPVTLNLLMVSMAIIGWIAANRLPSASHCRRVDPRRLEEERKEKIL